MKTSKWELAYSVHCELLQLPVLWLGHIGGLVKPGSDPAAVCHAVSSHLCYKLMCCMQSIEMAGVVWSSAHSG